MVENEGDERRNANARDPQTGVRLVRVADLLGGAREIILDHQGEHYRLRLTSKGKLILTK